MLALLLVLLLAASAHSFFSFSDLFPQNEIEPTGPSSANAGTNRDNDRQYPIYGDESLMAPREHGTCSSPVQSELR